jgi:predicted MPP superfamily phosphohydrolase
MSKTPPRQDVTTPEAPTAPRSKQYRRARLRHLIFTMGPDRLMGGLIRRRHLSQPVDIREIEVFSPRWPVEFDGLRIGHISDLHVGDLLPVERAVEIIERLRDQEPDLVACTGDVVDLDNHMAMPVLEAMGRIDAPLGSMLVLGNHDHLACGEELSRMAIDSGMMVLRDEVVEVVRNGGRLTLGGVDWSRTVRECTSRVQRVASDGLDLLLSHNPKSFVAAARMGVPLTLAGHTHGGQIARRKRPHHNLAMAHGASRGLYSRHDSHLYVTTGVGAWFPLRINCPAEIAMVTMRRGPSAVRLHDDAKVVDDSSRRPR